MFRTEGSAYASKNRSLATSPLIAGFVNSAGFVLAGSFTSDVTGNVGRLADDLALVDPQRSRSRSPCNAVASLVLRPGKTFNGVKVFSATMMPARDQLGDRVTEWMQLHPEYEVVEIVVTQSSDASFHCLAQNIFYWQPLKPR